MPTVEVGPQRSIPGTSGQAKDCSEFLIEGPPEQESSTERRIQKIFHPRWTDASAHGWVLGKGDAETEAMKAVSGQVRCPSLHHNESDLVSWRNASTDADGLQVSRRGEHRS